MAESDVLKHSVTREDQGDVRGASVFHWILGYQPTAGSGDLPPWWTPSRDWYLRQTIERESFWAGALSIAVTKMSSLAWELDSDAPRVRNYFQELLLTADNNQSWVNFLARHLMDFLCTDNGAFVEVVRATSAAGSRILGLVHLDSLRCLGRDSRVLMADGSVVPIYQVVNNQMVGPVMAIDESGTLVPKRITGWHKSDLGDRYWLRLKLAHSQYTFGRKQGLWVTNDHPMLTRRGYVNAEQLTKADTIATHYPDLSEQQKELLVGTLLGDATLFESPSFRNPKNVGIGLTHGTKQQAWLERKMNAFAGFRWSPIRTNRVTKQTGTQTTPALISWREAWYPNGKKVVPRDLVNSYLTPFALAVWYLDDGDFHGRTNNHRKPAARLSTHCFSERDVIYLAVILRNRFGIDAHVYGVSGTTDQFALYITTEDSKKFFALIAPYIPESMRYKIPEGYAPFDESLWNIEAAPRYYDTIESIEVGTNGEQTQAFCIDVEDLHNFVASGMAVHNCTRTGDPDYPVIYRDTKGINHEMQPYQVISFSDMPDPSETYYGVGHCAASRAYRGILKMAAIETYIYEKVSGRRALAVDLVGGISDKQLATAVTSAEEERIGKGYVSYMGAIVVPTLSDVAITHTRINFAELPDGFDREKEFNIGLLQYANAIGLDPQELQPLTGAALGTGTQAEVLSEKGKGKGLAAWRQQWTHAVNQFVMPDSVTFAFDENDLKDTQQKATISKTRADAMAVYIDKGIVTPSQAAQILADEGEIPPEFVPADQTPGGTLTDSEKPESEADQAEAQAEQAQATAPATEQAVKERLVEFDAAMKEFREAMKGEQ